MQARHGENRMYINRPKRMRHYLVQSSIPASVSNKPNHMQLLHQSLQSDVFLNIVKKKSYMESVAELARSNKRKASMEKECISNRPINFSININRIKKSNLKQDGEEQSPQRRTKLKKQLRIITSQDKIDHNNANQAQKEQKIKSPIFSIDKVKLLIIPSKGVRKFSNVPISYRKQKRQKSVEQILNFTPKHRSLNKMSVHIIGDKKGSKYDFIAGFIREKKLGKGGFSDVWQATQIKTGKQFAVKEIDLTNKYQTHIAQITFGSFFFQNGMPKQRFAAHPGIDVLLTMKDYYLSHRKAFVAYQLCSVSLSQYLYEIYQQTKRDQDTKQQKKYVIVHRKVYEQMRLNTFFLKNFIVQICKALELLQTCNIVHSDVKTSNILIKFDDQRQKYSFKLIDYGSSFFFQHLQQYRLATPEYMAPELVNYLMYQTKQQYNQQLLAYTKGYSNISGIDMWGLGCIILQIINGIPLWLNNKVKVKINGVYQYRLGGLFATDSRSYDSILEKQLLLIKNLNSFIEKENNSCILIDSKLKKTLKGLLRLDPNTRLRPIQVLQLLSPDFL